MVNARETGEAVWMVICELFAGEAQAEGKSQGLQPG